MGIVTTNGETERFLLKNECNLLAILYNHQSKTREDELLQIFEVFTTAAANLMKSGEDKLNYDLSCEGVQ